MKFDFLKNRKQQKSKPQPTKDNTQVVVPQTEVKNVSNEEAVVDEIDEKESKTLNPQYKEEGTDDLKNEGNTDDRPDRNDSQTSLTFSSIIRVIQKKWWMFLINCLLVGGISALLIIEEPRTFTTEIRLAPESSDETAGGSLSSIASSFGINLGNMTATDAIRPDLYPDLVESNDFICELFKLPVKSANGNIYTDYFTYLKKYQRSSWWARALKDFKKKFQEQPVEVIPAGKTGENMSNTVHYLTAEQERMIETVKNQVSCSIDKKTFVITINVTDQDPLIAATVADSVRSKIQSFITDYRTKKATIDFNYYYQLLKQAKSEYEKSCQTYAKYVDTHRDVILQAYISERDQLENDMQLKLNTYNAMITQAQTAKAKIQENTPVFTILQNAYVPVKPTGPKRMLFVLGMVFLTFTFTLFLLLRKILSKNLEA